MSENNGAHITLPLKLLSQIFSSFPELEGIHPKSPALGDIHARPRVIPHALGELLIKLDPAENYFHVIFQTISTKQYAEVWVIKEWLESNARRIYIREHSAERLAGYEQQKQIQLQQARLKAKQDKLKEVLHDKLAADFEAYRRMPGARQHLVDSIVKNYQSHDLKSVLKTLDLLEIIADYEKTN